MKFLTKINRNYIIPLVLVLIPVSIGGYFVLQSIIYNDTKEMLLQKEILIVEQIRKTGEQPNIYPIIETRKIFVKSIEKPTLKEIYIKNSFEDEIEPYLEYATQVKINNSYYFIKIRQSEFEDEDLVYILASMLFVLILIVFGISYFIVRRTNKTIWADFEMNLRTIENFSFSDSRNLTLKTSGINEFERLNKVVTAMTEKLQKDYCSLKEFTENASHEIQTPISIILLNLEELLQQDLSEQTFKMVLTTINAVKRLSTLNKSLLLLTKIENHQYLESNALNIGEHIENKIKEFSSLLETNNISVDFHTNEIFTVKINTELADILLNNIISNAIKHNINNGKIRIETYNNRLIICNTGKQHSLTNDNIFNRFTKENSPSYGLGLAIVKQICSLHNMNIHYEKNELHCFTIKSLK